MFYNFIFLFFFYIIKANQKNTPLLILAKSQANYILIYFDNNALQESLPQLKFENVPINLIVCELDLTDVHVRIFWRSYSDTS